jgi:hypothetical protein
MSTTRTTVATTPALSFYLPVLARLLMCSLFIWVPLLGEFARGGKPSVTRVLASSCENSPVSPNRSFQPKKSTLSV